MSKIFGAVFLGTVLSLSFSACATGRGPTTGSRVVDDMVVSSAVCAAGGAGIGAVVGHPGKGAVIGAIACPTISLLRHLGTGYVKVDSDIPALNFTYPSHDPLKGIVEVERWDGKRAVVTVAVDGKTVYRGSPPYSVKVAVNGFGRHEVSAEVFVWSASAGKYLPAQKFKTDFEVLPEKSCDRWGNCWRATISPSGISAY